MTTLPTHFDTVVNQSTGLPVFGAVVSVLDASGNPVQLYADAGAAQPIANPINQVTTNAAGLYQFYVTDGIYTLTQAINGASPVTINNVRIGDPTLNAAASFPVVTGTTPNNVFQLNAGAYLSSKEIPYQTVQGFTSKVLVPSSFTGAPWPVTGVSAYVTSANNAANNSHVGVFSFVGSASNGANPYCFNSILTNTDQPVVALGTNVGRDFVTAYGMELDFNIMKLTGGNAPSGSLVGISILGGSETNTTGHNSAIEVFGLGTTSLPWARGFHLRPGAATNGIQLDPSAWSGSGLYSQPIIFHSGAVTNGNTDSPAAGTLFGGYIRLTPSGSLELVGDPAINFAVTVGTVTISPTGLQLPETAIGSVPTPPSGLQTLFLDNADHRLKRKDSTGAVTVIG